MDNQTGKKCLLLINKKLMKTPVNYSIKNLLLLFGAILFPSFVFAQWSSPVNLSPNAINAYLNESMGPCIGVSGDMVHVVWADRFTVNKGAIYYTQSADTGLTWSSPVPITDVNHNAWNPAIAVNGSNIHVVWREIDTVTNHRSSWYKHSLDGGVTWGPVVVVDTAVADWPAVAVSGNYVYVANDIVTSATPYNTEIFFLRSLDNGVTWGPHQQVTFSSGRSEDEAITAQGSDIFMSWNDNRNVPLQIFYKHSADYGATWDPDVLINSEPSYGTMVSANRANIDIPSAGASSGHYQIHLDQSADSGATWGPDMNLTNDPANTYYYPYMVRDSNDLHMTYVKSGVGGQYLHSGDGGATWDPPFTTGFSGITLFIAYTGCVLHVIMPDSGHINYIRNPTGNAGPHCVTTTGIVSHPNKETKVKLYPNPFGSQTTIEISSSEKQENAILKVYDLLGQEIMTASFGNNNKLILGRDELNTGIYFYNILQKEKVLATGKIVVQ
jgi:hypothetical protein